MYPWNVSCNVTLMQVDFRRGVPKTAHWKSSVSGIPFILTPEKKCNQVAIPLKRDFLQLISHNCWWLYMLPLYHLGLWKYNKHKSNIPDGQYSLRQSHILKPTVWLHGSADGAEQWEWSSDLLPFVCVILWAIRGWILYVRSGPQYYYHGLQESTCLVILIDHMS